MRLNTSVNYFWRGLPLAVLALALLVAGTACTSSEGPPDGGETKLSVVTSIHPMEYFATRVGGDAVDVFNLVAPGMEAHGYEPSSSDLQRLSSADMVVMNGLELEPWLASALSSLGGNAPTVIIEAADEAGVSRQSPDEHGHEHDDEHDDDEHGHSAVEALEAIDHLIHEFEDGHLSAPDAMERIEHLIHDLASAERDELQQIDHVVHDWEDGRSTAEQAIELIEELVHDLDDGHGHDEASHEDHDEHDHGEFDPHVWLDPVIAIAQVERIRDDFIDLAPQYASSFRANAQALVDELNDLHGRFQSALSSCMHDHFVTTHAAYAYLAARYGLEQVSIAGLTPEAEPSAQRLAEISDQVRALGVRYILVEPILGSRLADTVRREAGGIELLPVHQIESVTLDEMDEHGDYMGLMENNLRSLSIALECN